MKKVFILALAVFVPVVALAQSGFVPLAPIPGLTDTANTAVVNSASLSSFFNSLYKYLIGLAAAIAVIEIIWGGLEISTKDSVSKQSDGKERITQAIYGLLLVLSPVLVFSIINPAILNLSLNLDPLDTSRAPVVTTPGLQASTPKTIGSGNSCGLISVGGSKAEKCSVTIFNDGPYSAPVAGTYCYQFANPLPANDKEAPGATYMCYKNKSGCTVAITSKSATGVTAPTSYDPGVCVCTPGDKAPCN